MRRNVRCKYAVILPDGAADEPVVELDGKTPLDAARTPNIDWVAGNGRQGCVVTVPKGFSPASDVATLSLLGYDPHENYHGRAPLEATARGIETTPDQTIFRCNFVTIVDGTMTDFTAGHIGQIEANRLIADLNKALEPEGCTFHGGVSYRNLMIASIPGNAALRCTPPHDIPDQPVKNHRPKGKGSDWVRRIMDVAHEVLRRHDVNLVRQDLGDNPATDIWLWGQGQPKPLVPFADRFGIGGACIAGVDLIRGIALSAGMKLIDVPGATGYLDTDYAGKGAAAVEALQRVDMTIVHIEAPDEAGHLGDAQAKIAAIERIDEHIVGPMLDGLRSFDRWRLLIAPDHPTPVGRRVHTSTPPPFCFAGNGVDTVLNQPFSEAAARRSDLFIDPGCALMEYFLKT